MKSEKIVKALCECGICRSRGEARRYILQKAVFVDEKCVDEIDAEIEEGQTIRVGKTRTANWRN